MKKNLRNVQLLILLLLSFPFCAMSQCGVSPTINVLPGTPTGDLRLDASQSVLWANWTVYNWEWTVNGTVQSNLVTTNNMVLPYVYSEVCIKAWATDTVTGDSCITKHCNIFQSTDLSPYIMLDVDSSGPLTVDFVASIIGGNGFPSSAYSIDFGDGNSVLSNTATHTYSAPGDYTAVAYISGWPVPTTRKVHVDNGIPNMQISNATVYTYCDSIITNISTNPPFFSSTAELIYDAWQWYPSDGINETYAYQVPGQSYVRFTLSDGYGDDLEYYYPVWLSECARVPDTATGTVWYDADADGIYDSTEVPLENKKIEALFCYYTTTDSSGFYSILLPRVQIPITLDSVSSNAITFPASSSYTAFVNAGPIHSNWNFGVADITVTIGGYTYLDYNQDSIYNPPGDVAFKNVSIKAYNSITGKDYYSSSDNYGYYNFALPAGNYTIKATSYGLDSAYVTPDSIQVNTTGGNYSGKNFGFYSSLAGGNLNIVLGSSGHPRPGFNYTLNATVRNSGIDTAQGAVVITYPAGLVFNGTTFPAGAVHNIANHTFTWTTGIVTPTAVKYFSAGFIVPAATDLGTVLNSSCIVTTDAGYIDHNLTDNNDSYTDIVIGSFDPNDKLVTPSGIGSTGAVHHDQRLYYRINFQNTGTASAINVIVQDVIDSNLDMNTFRMERASALYKLVTNGRTITWKFFNINLPDSNTNEPASHGFVEFSIVPMQGLPDGTPVNNSADIYFDFNSPVTTNTVTNTLQTSIAGINNIESNEKLIVMPNPFSDNLNVQLTGYEGKLTVTLYDVTGRSIAKVYDGRYVKGQKIMYNTKQFSEGVYFIKAQYGKNTFMQKLVK
ncbi:MAG: T9SS type A sorting domain-containing protein [Bacteroidia bacterium]